MKYKVVKIMKKSKRQLIIEKGLTRKEALRLVNSYPDAPKSMVVCLPMT